MEQQKQINLTKEVYDTLSKRIDEFNQRTDNNYHMDMSEVLYSFFESTETTHYVLSDYDEGRNNDPYWDEVKDMHCCYSFLEDMNEFIRSL